MKILAELESLRKEAAELEGKELVNDLDQEETHIVEENAIKEDHTEEKSEEENSDTEQEVKKEEPGPAKSAEVQEEEKPDNSAYARMRRENAALKKQLADKKEPKKEETPEDQQEEANRLLVDVIKTVQEQRAEKEFASLEGAFAMSTPDYEDVSNQYKMAVYQAMRVQNPRDSHPVLVEKVKKSLLTKAGQYVREGLDPIQEMYEEAKSLGFKAIPKEESAKVEEEKVRPDLSKVASNRSRNAGTVGAKGSNATGHMTRMAAADLPAHEWAKLPKAERQRYLKNMIG